MLQLQRPVGDALGEDGPGSGARLVLPIGLAGSTWQAGGTTEPA